MKKRVTLQDIANVCGVSRALVSVVLNGKEGRISCTEACRQKIHETAEQLGYAPNRLAQSMSSGRPPVVAVMLHLDVTELFSGSYYYFNELFPKLTLELNARGLEVMFIPCRSAGEFITRFERLQSDGLAGAVISNIFPDAYTEFAGKLANSGMPYMILGYPYGVDCHCIYYKRSFQWLDAYLASHREYQHCWILTRIQDKHVLCRYPFKHDYIWLAEKSEPLPEILQEDTALIVCAGLSLYKAHHEMLRHPLIWERMQKAELLPPGVANHLEVPAGVRSKIAAIAAEQVADWLLLGKESEMKQICIEHKTKESNA